MKKTFLALFALIVLLCISGCNTNVGEKEGAFSEISTSASASDEAAKEAAAPKEDFEYYISGGSANIKKYIGNESVVVIPEEIEGYNITSIDAHFLEGSDVEEITYPNGITEFRGLSRCENLKTLHLPASVEKMQDSLRFCENLTEIDIQEGGAYKTADGVLYTSDMKTLVSYPRGRTGIFVVPDVVESIGIYAFCNSKLSEIVLPDSLKTIEAHAFMNAEELNEAIIPYSVKEIGFSAFSESGIKKVTLSEGVEEINANAFSETRIKELYIPDSVQSCGSGIVDENVYIFASYPSEGLKALTRYKNVNFRDETRLEEAFRKAEEIVKKYDNIRFYNGVIFTDITGDAFPEIIALSGSSEIEIYFYSQKGVWQGLYSDATTIGYYRSDLKLHLIYDGENDTYSYYTDVYNARFRGGYGGIVTGDGMYSQCSVSFTEEGMEYTELFNDDVKNLSSEEIIETIDVSGIINSIVSEYGIDLQEQYKKFTVIADGLAEEPDGKIGDKAVTLNGKLIEEFPYFESGYPEALKLTVAGRDILRGEDVEGVYFKDGVLTLENAVIDARGKEYVIESENIPRLEIELIGENRVVFEKTCSLLNIGLTGVVFMGDGGLEAPEIRAKRIDLKDSVSLTEINSPWSGGIRTDVLNLYDNSRIEYNEVIASLNFFLYDNAHAEIKYIETNYLSLSDNSYVNIINDLSGRADNKGSAVNHVKTITVENNARLYADNSFHKCGTLIFGGTRPYIKVSGSGYLEINGSGYGAGISMLQSGYGRVEVKDKGSIVINGSGTCISAPRVEISGGSMSQNIAHFGIDGFL